MNSIINTERHDKLKGWLHSVKKKTTRLSTRITAKLGIISLTRDEEFDRQYQTFKNIEKTIRNFIKNLNAFIEHFEHFLMSLQQTSDNLADFYRDKSYQRELEELKRSNKVLACQYFTAFKKTVDENVVTVASELLQRFAIPHQLIHKRNTKLLDYYNKTREMESCRDETKKQSLKDQYVIAKDIYEKINKQLIEQLPVFNQISLHIFKECIIGLLENRRSLIESYANQVSGLLKTPLMMNYTANEVASSLLDSAYPKNNEADPEDEDRNPKMLGPTNRSNHSLAIANGLTQGKSNYNTGQTSDSGGGGSEDYASSRAQSPTGQLGFDPIVDAITNREMSSSTPLPQQEDMNNSRSSANQRNIDNVISIGFKQDVTSDRYDEVDHNIPHHELSVISKPSLNSSTTGTSQQPVNRNNLTISGSTPQMKRKHRFPTYIALWEFEATDRNQLTIEPRQELKLIKACDESGNNEWSLVKDKKNRVGYVPSTYIKKKSLC